MTDELKCARCIGRVARRETMEINPAVTITNGEAVCMECYRTQQAALPAEFGKERG